MVDGRWAAFYSNDNEGHGPVRTTNDESIMSVAYCFPLAEGLVSAEELTEAFERFFQNGGE